MIAGILHQDLFINRVQKSREDQEVLIKDPKLSKKMMSEICKIKKIKKVLRMNFRTGKKIKSIKHLIRSQLNSVPKNHLLRFLFKYRGTESYLSQMMETKVKHISNRINSKIQTWMVA